ncbi:MAG: 3-methyl-2-oxobutanoate hydroxymethyltransferase [Zoogloeaceae bacterium]|jgi:3-methyl-2-oxobutanoate hydroxymethyltransferase|nr:3-methyl-2-oxobutanoate hydroxymethyltransferase [Zoogloeaceae bacterium]
MSAHTQSRRLTHLDLVAMHQKGEKIAMLTCYDASFAQMLDEAGVDALLVGDSLGNVVQGQDSTLPVTLEHMIYHTMAVARGSRHALVVADLPFGASQINPEETFRNAARLMAAGAQMVKFEGGAEMAATAEFLSHRGIPVCAHIGLTPQSVHQLGGFRVQGRDEATARKLLADARALAAAGATQIVLEAMPSALAAEITRHLMIPTIGIGAGAETSGQVLVIYDMLNIGARDRRKPRFVRNFMADATSPQTAAVAYVDAVKQGAFPAPEHGY